MKLFQQQEMSHTPHILATVFLCGLWLPIWILTAATHNPPWLCSFCGFSDQMKYLMNPDLRQLEARQQAERVRAYNQSRSDGDSTVSGISRWWLALNSQQKTLIFVASGILGITILISGSMLLASNLPQPVENTGSTNVKVQNEQLTAMANRREFAGALQMRYGKTMPKIEITVGGTNNETLYVHHPKITAAWVDKFWQADNVVEMRKAGFYNVVISADKGNWNRTL